MAYVAIPRGATIPVIMIVFGYTPQRELFGIPFQILSPIGANLPPNNLSSSQARLNMAH